MAVAFRSANTGTFTADASPGISAPAGVEDGDLLLYGVATDTVHVILNAPTGWTQVGTSQDIAGTDSTLSVFWKIASSEPGSYTFDTPGNLFDALESGVGAILAYSGAHQVSPIDTTNQSATGNAQAHTTAAITPSVDDCMIVAFVAADSPATQAGAADGTPTPDERADLANGTTGWIFAMDALQAGAAPVDLSVTLVDIDSAGNVILAIAPAGAVEESTLVDQVITLVRPFNMTVSRGRM
jgi:hypothetical protein